MKNCDEVKTELTQIAPQEMVAIREALWPSSIKPALHFMSWHPGKESTAEVEAYAQSFAQLLGAQLTFQRDLNNPLADKVQAQHPDLIIFHSPASLLPFWLMSHSTEKQLLKRMPSSLLILRGFNWPLRKILLILRGSEFDNAAIAWMTQIAFQSSVAVTVLPILAPVPHLFRGIPLGQCSLIHLLNSSCPLGKRLKRIFHYFETQKIQGALRLQEGIPNEQMRQEIETCDYDLVIIAADTEQSILHWMMGELVNPLLRLAETPILIAKTMRSQQAQTGSHPKRANPIRSSSEQVASPTT